MSGRSRNTRASSSREAGPAEWVVAERERLRVMAANTAYSAGQLSLLLRPPPEALPLAQRATLLDPLRDSAWALLAETQERMGDSRRLRSPGRSTSSFPPS